MLMLFCLFWVMRFLLSLPAESVKMVARGAMMFFMVQKYDELFAIIEYKC